MAVKGGITLPVGLDLKDVDGDARKIAQRFKEVTQQIEIQSKKVDDLRARLAGLEDGSIAASTREIQKMQTEFEKTSASVEKTKAEINSLGGQLTYIYDNAFKDPVSQQPVFTQGEQAQIDAINAKLDQLEPKLEADRKKAAELGEALKNATGAATQSEIEATKQKLAEAETKLDGLKIKAENAGEKLKAKMSESTNATSSVVSGLEAMSNKIIGMAKRVFIFSMITKALRNVGTAILDIVLSSPAMQGSMEQLTNAFYMLATPIYESVMPALTAFINMLARAITYVATFIYALMGKSYKQLVNNSKALKKQVAGYKSSAKAAKKSTKANKDNAKSVKEVNKELASFDELIILQQKQQSGIDTTTPIGGGSSSGGMGGSSSGGMGGSSVPDIGIDDGNVDFIENIGKWAREHKNLFLAAGGIAALCAGISKLLPLFSKKDKGLDTQTPKVEAEKSAVSALSNAFQSALLPLAGVALGIGLLGKKADTANEPISELEPALKPIPNALSAAEKATTSYSEAIPSLSEALDLSAAKTNAFENAIAANVQRIIQAHPELQTLTQEVNNLQNPETQTAATTDILTASVDKMGQTAENMKPKIDVMKTALGDLKAQAEETDSGIKTAASNIQTNVSTSANAADTSVKTSSSNIETNIGNATSNSKENIKTFGEKSTEIIMNWGKDVNNKVADTYENVDTNERNALENSASNQKEFGKVSSLVWAAIGNTIMSMVKQSIKNSWTNFTNGLESMWNSLVNFLHETGGSVDGSYSKSGLNTTEKTLVGGAIGGGFLELLKYAPMFLAQGAVIPPNREFLAVLGDQKRGTNIEAPLDTIKQAVAEVLANSGYSGGNQPIILELDGREVGRTFGKAIRQEANRVGNSFMKTKLVF